MGLQAGIMANLSVKWSKKYKIVGDINFFRCMAKNGKKAKNG
jgi:hypothetical protein